MPHQTEAGQLSIKSLPAKPRQARFVDEYLLDLNATQAAIRAGYSAKTAQEQGSRLLSNVIVQDAVAEAMAARSERTQVTAGRVVQELAKIAFADMADYRTLQIKDHDKIDALNSLGKHLGMFIERKEVAMPGEITFRIGHGYVDKIAD